jgi:hypothetical protein
MSLARLTALSTQTLSLLLERQRLQSLSPAVTEGATNSSLHLPQITRNLALLRSGILELESTGDHSQAVVLLRNQHVRMRGMVGSDAVIEPLPEPTPTQEDNDPQAREKPQHAWPVIDKHAFMPYTDDPEAGRDPVSVLQEQQRLMDGTCRAPPRLHDILLKLNRGLQTRTYIWIRFHARLRVSVTCRCRSMTSLMCTRDCWRSWTMISMIQEFALVGLVNDSDELPMVQRSTVSGDPLRVWYGS